MRGANLSRRIGRGASPRRPLPRGKSAALETAFVMGERRDVWYNMRMKGSVKMTQVKSPRQEDGVRSGWKTTGMA